MEIKDIKDNNKNYLMNLSILLLIISFCALRNWNILMYFSQLLFLFFILIRYFKKKELRVSDYALFNFSFLVFSMISVAWATSYNQWYSAFISLFQITIICILLSDYLDTDIKINKILNYFLISSIIMVIYLVINTPITDWVDAMQASTDASTSENRIGPSIGFQPNALGMICGFTIVIWLYFMTNQKKYKNISIIMILTLMGILLFTKSRKAFITAVFGLIMYWILYKPRKKAIFLILIIMTLGLLLTLWLIMNVPFLYNIFGFRLIGIFGLFDSSISQDASVTTRGDMVQIGIDLFKERPINGVGFGNFSYYYFHSYNGWAETYAHNNYVELLSSTGIVGTVLYYLVPFSMIFSLIKNWKVFININRKLTAFLFTIITLRLIMDYGMVSYDHEFIQLLTVVCYCAVLCLKNKKRLFYNGFD